MKSKLAIGIIILLIGSLLAFLFLKGNDETEKQPKDDLKFTEIKENEQIDWDPNNEEDLKKHINVERKDGSNAPFDYQVKQVNENEFEIIVTSKDSDGKEVSKSFKVKTKNKVNESEPNGKNNVSDKGDSKKEDSSKGDSKINKDAPLVNGEEGNYDNVSGELEIPETVMVGGVESVKKPDIIPDGFKLKKDDGQEQTYSYDRKLPGGGYINEIVVSKGAVLFHGKDNVGKYLSVSYYTNRDSVVNTMGMSRVSDDDVIIFYEIGELMSKAYGDQMIYD